MARISESPSQINLMDVIRGMWRWKLLLIMMPLIGLFVGEGVLLVNKPSYQSEAQVIVQSLATPFDKISSVAEQSAGDAGPSDRLVFSQVSVLKSRDLAARVVDQLSLDTKPEYNTQLTKRSLAGTALIMLGFKDDPTLFQPKDLAIKNLTGKVTVYPVPDSNVIGIKSNSGDPEIAAAIANAFAETYVLSTHEVGQTATDRARNWLSQQIDDLRTKVAASENAVEKYRADNGLLKGANTTISKQQLTDINAQIAVADSAKAEAQAKADEINRLLKAGGRLDISSDVLSSTLVQALREQEVQAERKVAELSATYLPGHPKMIAAMKELNGINAQVRAEAMRVAQSLQSQAKIADQRAASARASLDKLKTDQATANFSDVKLQELDREAAANRTLLQNMLARYADANARQDASLQPGYARVIQKASVPSVPYFPKPGPILLLSGLGGLIMGLGLAFFFEILSAGSSKSVEIVQAPRARSAPVLEADEEDMPAVEPRPARETHIHSHPLGKAHVDDVEVPPFEFPNKNQPAVDALAATATQRAPAPAASLIGSIPGAVTLGGAFAMLGELRLGGAESLDAGAKKIASILSAVKNEKGRAVCAVASIGSQVPNAALSTAAAARELGQRGEKVIALDFSPAVNNLETLLDVPQGLGLIELVAGDADFTKVVTRCSSMGFHMIRLGQPRGAEQLQAVADKLPSFLNALGKIYGYIFLHVGEGGPKTVTHMTASDVAVLLAPQARILDAKAAAAGLEERSATRALVMRLESETTHRPLAAVPA
ncbi:GumC family protein [Aestuariivirga litoralis]|uniref:GumC family protein n=1 Tax=Aestuariivirga litoralis TaxID=2650924 RepID=UPI0018C556B1|nr:GumC family protein [Aestuariivirga litoralis]MBG1231783.1 hypothetical protein [Aestuariivirga litoralis]